jgi:DNA-binding NtrC family response regulator
MILCNGDRIHAGDLPLGVNVVDDDASDSREEFLSLEQLERLHIQRVFAATERNLTRTAELLGITRTTLYSKLRKYQPDDS